MKKLAISVLLVSLLAACASEKPKEPVAEAKASSGCPKRPRLQHRQTCCCLLLRWQLIP